MTKPLHLHIDETGSQDLSEGSCLVAVVFHEHSMGIQVPSFDTGRTCRRWGLPMFTALRVFEDCGRQPIENP